MKCYTLIAGVKGAGKSSFLGVLKCCGSDLGSIIGVDRPSLKHTRAASKRTFECLERHGSLTVETSLATGNTLSALKIARINGYRIKLYYIGLESLEQHFARTAPNNVNSTSTLQCYLTRRFNRRLADLMQVLPYCDEAVFLDNQNGFTEVGEYRHGSIYQRGGLSPQWFEDIYRHFETESK